jgi:hypothetical protein
LNHYVPELTLVSIVSCRPSIYIVIASSVATEMKHKDGQTRPLSFVLSLAHYAKDAGSSISARNMLLEVKGNNANGLSLFPAP